ncbi:MAG: PEP-CTERM sorting domain-containing protein [Pirellulales bacterium]|nr:PEP-CTERM sorting domain-containing protein [Pirellulales bacterium]
MNKSIAIIMAVALLAWGGSVQAGVEFISTFDNDGEGWTGGGSGWEAGGGQDGGYYFGTRLGSAPYLTPPPGSILYNDVAANFNNKPINFSYYLKDISDTLTSVPQIYVFADGNDDGTWDLFWAYTPEAEGMPAEWNGIPKDWTMYSYTIDPTADAAPPGWTMHQNGSSTITLTWAESWRKIFTWNFWSGAGTTGMDSVTGIDTVVIASVPEPATFCLLFSVLGALLMVRNRHR